MEKDGRENDRRKFIERLGWSARKRSRIVYGSETVARYRLGSETRASKYWKNEDEKNVLKPRKTVSAGQGKWKKDVGQLED